MTDVQNVLVRVPGEFVARALQALPDAATDREDQRETVIDVPELGTVRFTCRRLVSRRGKARVAFWTAERAELLG